MVPEITIDSMYLYDESGTSDGTQIKYFFENRWYKVDRYGGEGICEELVSNVLKICGMDKSSYVSYKRIIINGSDGCVSNNFLSDGEFFVSLYRLHSNIVGTDPARITAGMDYDDAIRYIIDFVKKHAGINITEYLANTFVIDALILNDDRHFNNLGIISNGSDYRIAPIFDNGKSLFIGNERYRASNPMKDNKKIAFAKAFSGSFELNRSFLQEYATFAPDYSAIMDYLKTKDLKGDNVYSRLYKLCEIS